MKLFPTNYHLIILLIIFFISTNALAQKTDTTFFYDASISSRLSRGNLNKFVFNSSLRLEKSNHNLGYRFSSSTFHTWLNGDQLDEDFIQKIVIYHRPFLKLSPYFVFKFEKSRRRGLESKYMPGFGLSYQFIRNEKHSFRLSGNLTYDITAYTSSDLKIIGEVAGAERNIFRNTLFFNGRHALLENNLNINYEGWFQAALKRIKDFRAQIQFNLDKRLYKSIFLRTSLFYFYESILPIELEENDLRLGFGIAWKRQ